MGEKTIAASAWHALLDSPNETVRETAHNALDTQPDREQRYQTAMAAARQPLETLLRRHLLEGELAHKHYALSQMEQCAEHLREAAAIRPLAPEVQTLVALLAMQRNDFAQAEWNGR